MVSRWVLVEDLCHYTFALVQNILLPLEILLRQHRLVSSSMEIPEDVLFTMIDSVSTVPQDTHERIGKLAK